jgi:hypothetical protein
MSTARAARKTLALIRIANGALALAAPERLAARLGVDASEQPALLYVFRMFGVRTVVVGRDLLRDDERAIRSAPLVHASDTLAAALAARTGILPPRAGRLITAISAFNTLLAVVQRRGARMD